MTKPSHKLVALLAIGLVGGFCFVMVYVFRWDWVVQSDIPSPCKDAQLNPGCISITKEQAISIANRHFGRQLDAGCFIEERGGCYFVAPPLKHINDSERAGIYVDKCTGKIHH